MSFCLIYSSFPDEPSARSVVRALLMDRLLACATLLPNALSIYQWKGELCETQEILVIFKTAAELVAELEKRFLELHPYEVPEFVVIPWQKANSSYESWIMEELKNP